MPPRTLSQRLDWRRTVLSTIKGQKGIETLMRRTITTAVGLWLTLAGAGLAQPATESPVVVELYTSQGCSSCPPADNLLSEMAGRSDVIALALHVDYWDYIGWKDTFGNPAFTKRQRAYAAVAGARTIYTPQMIVDGMDHIVGVRAAELAKLVARHAAQAAPVALRLDRVGEGVRVTAGAAPLPRGAVVQLVRYRSHERVEIRQGENAGKVIDYSNIVTEWRRVAEWDGRADLSLTMDAPGGDPVVVILQEPGPGPVLAAAVLR